MTTQTQTQNPPTLHDFFTQPGEDEAVVDGYVTPELLQYSAALEQAAAQLPKPLGPGSVQPASGAMAKVLEHLERIEAMIQAPTELEQRLESMTGHAAEHMKQATLLEGRIAEALEAIKKSTSQVANKVRAILEPEPLAPLPDGAQSDVIDQGSAAAAEAPAGSGEGSGDAVEENQAAAPAAQPAPEAKQPPTDASVEVWRQYARGRRSAMGVDVDKLNRSQIRTLLGIEQPVIGQQAAGQSAEG